jgi:DNA-binding MarR family transcriptional regulator
MTPKQAFRFMKAKKVDFKELMLLEQMASYPKEVLTQQLVNDALLEKISSPATTHKYLARFKRRRFVKDVKHKGQDQRCHYIVVTDEGKSLLKEWA